MYLCQNIALINDYVQVATEIIYNIRTYICMYKLTATSIHTYLYLTRTLSNEAFVYLIKVVQVYPNKYSTYVDTYTYMCVCVCVHI